MKKLFVLFIILFMACEIGGAWKDVQITYKTNGNDYDITFVDVNGDYKNKNVLGAFIYGMHVTEPKFIYLKIINQNLEDIEYYIYKDHDIIVNGKTSKNIELYIPVYLEDN